MDRVAAELDALVDRTGFAGAVRLRRAGVIEYERATGDADRAHGIANTLDTQFGTASIVKGFTALTVMSLVGEDVVALDTRVREVLDYDELALVDPSVTIGQLLAHTSGIGDY